MTKQTLNPKNTQPVWRPGWRLESKTPRQLEARIFSWNQNRGWLIYHAKLMLLLCHYANCNKHRWILTIHLLHLV